MNKKGFISNLVFGFCWLLLLLVTVFNSESTINYRHLAMFALVVLILFHAVQAYVYSLYREEDDDMTEESENEDAGETEGSVDESGREPGSVDNVQDRPE